MNTSRTQHIFSIISGTPTVQGSNFSCSSATKKILSRVASLPTPPLCTKDGPPSLKILSHVGISSTKSSQSTTTATSANSDSLATWNSTRYLQVMRVSTICSQSCYHSLQVESMYGDQTATHQAGARTIGEFHGSTVTFRWNSV